MNKKEYEELVKGEGDHYEFEASGLHCVLNRNKNGGHWCGYVGVPSNSVLAGKDYFYYSRNSENGITKLESDINDISVHGGLTFSGKAYWDDKDDNYYFGFDCAHSGDLMKYSFDYRFVNTDEDIYRTKEDVIDECKRLAKQLNKILKNKY